MENLELTALIPQAQAGDMAAMEELLRRAHTPVSYQCRKMLKDPRDAEDMTQEVLLTVYTRLELLKNPAAFWGWLNNITVNRCVNAIKRTHVEFQFAEDEEGHSVLDSLEELDEQQIPDKALDNAETTRMIEEIVSGLSDAQRICTLMFYYDEMSVREIASVLEIPENTVKSRLNYARKAIKERVLDYEKQGVKLYGLSPLPFLLYFLRRGADAAANPADAAALAEKILLSAGVKTAASAAAAEGAKTAAAQSTATSAAAGSAAKAAGGISAKLIAGIAAAAIAAGAAVGGIVALQSRAPQPEIVEEPPAIVLSQTYIDQLPYTGEECVLSADQARAFAEVIQRYSDESAAASTGLPRYCRAALFDAGDGIPALLISSGNDLGYGDDSGYLPSLTAVYQWDGTQAVLFQEDNASDYVVTDQGLLIDTLGQEETQYAYSVVYPLAGGIIGPQASHVYELFPLLQSGMPSEDAVRALVEQNGRSAEYDYDTLSQAFWTTKELWEPLWTIAALDGAFRSPDDQAGQVYTYATVDWLVGHGQAGITDASHLWEGEWMDALPTAQVLEEGADAAEAEQGPDAGEAQQSEQSEEETSPSAPAEDENGPAVNLPNAPYDYSVSYDSAAHIQRVTVDPMGNNADIFIEIPVFPETGAGYQKINAFFREKRDSFLMDAGGDIAMLLELASGSSSLHTDTQEVRIEYPMDGVVSVLYTICWDAGGQIYYDNESYLFNTETGSALKLADLIDGSEAEIKAGILADVRSAITDVPALQSWDLEDFDFYIENGQIWITFGRTELPGIGGAPDVPLSAPLHLGNR